MAPHGGCRRRAAAAATAAAAAGLLALALPGCRDEPMVVIHFDGQDLGEMASDR